VQGVVATARRIDRLLTGDDRIHLLAAAYLHDVGYAPEVVRTGFHPLDGALYLRALGHDRLACLVAHHSEARFEAQARGLTDALAAFHRERGRVTDALIYCDQLTGPTGQLLTLRERRLDILARYGLDHIVYQSYLHALPYLSLAVARTQRRLRQAKLSA
jgi:hypothetical protein